MDAIISSVAEATLVSKCVLCLLLMMSVLSWAFMAGKWLALRAARKRAGDGLAAFDEARSLRIALDKLEDDIRSPLLASPAGRFGNSTASMVQVTRKDF